MKITEYDSGAGKCAVCGVLTDYTHRVKRRLRTNETRHRRDTGEGGGENDGIRHRL